MLYGSNNNYLKSRALNMKPYQFRENNYKFKV